MAIEKQTYLYEVLVRFSASGLQGAHQQHMERVVDTKSGEVYSSKALDPEPLDPEVVAELLGKRFVELEAQIRAANEARDAAVAGEASARAEITNLTERLAANQAEQAGD